MLARIVTSRATARATVAGLALALVALAALALSSSTNTRHATAHLRTVNQRSDTWGRAFEQVNLEDEALHDYLRAGRGLGSDLGREPLTSAVGGADAIIGSLAGQGGPADQIAAVRDAYRGYTAILRELLAADRRGDRAQVALHAEQAELMVSAVRKVIAATIDRERLGTTQYLDEVDRRNQQGWTVARLLLAVGLGLLALFSAVLLGYQRRVERHAARSQHHLAELQAAYAREQQAQAARAAMEVELRHAQKLEAVGQLASGIAHEINTPIQFIADNVQSLAEAFAVTTRLLHAYRGALQDGDPVAWPARRAELDALEAEADVDYLVREAPEAAQQILQGTSQVARIVRAMRAFGHPDNGQQTSADLNEALQTTLTVAHNELKHTADVQLDLGRLPLLTCYLSDLNQVFLNLLVNAAHAVADTGRRGTITVSTRHEGDHVAVGVADTGTGIPEGIRERIFEPFFTTKQVGRGTGQGLALAHTIVVDRHGGTITVDSEVGRGTTFRVRLPLAGQPAEAQPASGSEAQPASGSEAQPAATA